MEFSLNPEFPINLGRKTSKNEDGVRNRVLHSKLAYVEVTSLNSPQVEIIESSSFGYTKNGEVERVEVPPLTNDTRMASYFIRMTVDANAVKRGCLPLHAAAYMQDGAAKFILGDTHRGKSFVLNMLLSEDLGVVPIGDDHIIMGKEYVFGNNVTRNRNNGKDVYSFFKKDLISSIENYEIILIDVTGKDNISEVVPKEVLRDNDIKDATLKYLIKKPIETDARNLYENLVGEKVTVPYEKMYENFLIKSSRIRKISGCKEYLLEEMLK